MDTKRSTCRESIVLNPFSVALIRIKARQLCRRSDFSRSDYDDLRQDMRLYLIKKARLFDPVRGNLKAFVTNALNTWVAIRLRYRNCDKRRESYKAVSLERTTVECDGDITTLGDVLMEEDGRRMIQAYGISAAEQFELHEAIEHAMGNLEPDDRVMLIQMSKKGIAGTAKSLGISYRQANNAMRRIREIFKKMGLDPN